MEPTPSAWDIRGPIPSVTDRYYTKYYATDLKGRPKHDQLILQHSNRVMVVCLAPSHPLLLDGVTIDRVEYQIGKLDRASNVVSGKFKSKPAPFPHYNSIIIGGGQKLTPTSPLCIVHCHGDDNKYIIYSCVKGTLIEINERLLTKPQLLQTHADSQGFVAIVLPNKITDIPTIFDQLLTIEQYQSLRKE